MCICMQHSRKTCHWFLKGTIHFQAARIPPAIRDVLVPQPFEGYLWKGGPVPLLGSAGPKVLALPQSKALML